MVRGHRSAQELRRAGPENSEAWFALGYAYYGQNGKKSCEASYEPYTRCIALDPKHATAHNNLGLVLKDVRKDYDDAEQARGRRSSSTEERDAHNNLGSLLKTCARTTTTPSNVPEGDRARPACAAHNNLGSLEGRAQGLRRCRASLPEGDRARSEAHVARWNLSIILENQKNNIPGAVKLVGELWRPRRQSEKRGMTRRGLRASNQEKNKSAKTEAVAQRTVPPQPAPPCG